MKKGPDMKNAGRLFGLVGGNNPSLPAPDSSLRYPFITRTLMRY